MIHWFLDSFVHPSIHSVSQSVSQSVSHSCGLFRWFIDPVAHWIVWTTGSLNHWFVDSLFHWLTEPLNRWFIALLHWIVESVVHWFIDSVIHWFIDLLIICDMIYADFLFHWSTDSWINWILDSFVHSVSFSELCMDSFISLSSQQPLAHSLMHPTTSTLHCFCIANKAFPIGHWFPIATSYFETSAPARAGRYLVYACNCMHVYIYIICWYKYIYISIYLSIYLSVYLSICLSIHPWKSNVIMFTYAFH